jgi:hypothetical protein
MIEEERNEDLVRGAFLRALSSQIKWLIQQPQGEAIQQSTSGACVKGQNLSPMP